MKKTHKRKERKDGLCLWGCVHEKLHFIRTDLIRMDMNSGKSEPLVMALD